MPDFTRPLQVERGPDLVRKDPHRPAHVMMRQGSGTFTLPLDAAPVDWTDSANEITLDSATEVRLMDDQDNMVAGDFKDGLYRVTMFPTIRNISGSDVTCRMAITSKDGSTVYDTVPNFTVFNNVRLTPVFTRVVNVTGGGGLTFRLLKTVGAGTTTVVNGVYCVMVERIGPAGEA